MQVGANQAAARVHEGLPVAEDLRRIMAQLGFRTVDQMVGRVDCLVQRKDITHWKAKGIDLSSVLYNPPLPHHVGRRCTQKQDHGLEGALDLILIKQLAGNIEKREPVTLEMPITNVRRAVGANGKPLKMDIAEIVGPAPFERPMNAITMVSGTSWMVRWKN